jgi:hypothetical protein
VLTGTPALSRPVELFTLLSTLRPDVPQFANYLAFVQRFCDAQRRFVGGRYAPLDVRGCSNAPELHGLLTSHAMVRRLKADVLPQARPRRLTAPAASDAAAAARTTQRLAQLLACMQRLPPPLACLPAC